MTYVHWPDFRLEWRDDGTLRFVWPQCSLTCDAGQCTQVRLVAQESDGSCQMLFQLQMRAPLTPGLVVVRVDVPSERVLEAQEVTELLRKRLRLPARASEQEEEAEEGPLERVPLDSPQWIAAPAGRASEELFGVVMTRIAEGAG